MSTGEYTPESISVRLGLPVDLVAEAIPRLINIGWLEESTYPDASGQCRDSIPIYRDYITEHNITEQNRESLVHFDKRTIERDLDTDENSVFGLTPTTDSATHPTQAQLLERDQAAWFVDWWLKYWRKDAKQRGWEKFRSKVTTPALFRVVMQATDAQSPEMLSREMKHRPMAATWLHQQRWDDPVEVSSDEALRRSLEAKPL